KGCMYVWKKGDQWSFKTNFLESIKTGIFDTQLDKDVITTLNTQPLGDITSEISSIRHGLNRPYLNLTPYQQAILVAAMSLDWPLNDKLSSDEQIQACHAIIEGGPLPESIANNEKLNSDINAFRPYLFPSTINNLYENNPHFTSKPAPTIADIVLFTDYLLIGAAQTLGDKLPININPPPKSSEVMCGQLEDVSNQSRLLYQGLSEGQSELFQLIMNAQMQGLEAMPVEQLVRLPALLYAVMEPSGEGHELIELSSDLIASIAAQQNILQEEAKKKLKETCGNMIRQANKIARRKLISLLQEEALALNPNETLKVLAEWFFKSDNLTQANRDAVTQHQNPESVADALITLHQAGLLKGEAAQANLDTVIQHQNPYKVADALITLHQAGLLKGEAAQANRNAITQHQDLKDVTYALKMLHHEGPLQDEAAQANFNAVVQHQDPWMVADALITLHQANLLKGEAAQANREAITQHQNPESVAGALIILHQADLLKGEAAQANFNAVVQHQDPCKVADALIILHQAGLLTGEAAQANREALAQHEDPMSFANELIMRHETETLADNTTQTNHNAASQKQLKEDLNNLKPSSKPEQNEGPEAELNARKP
nr:hypothetical protein [Gammaproteobacteria bacterium]